MWLRAWEAIFFKRWWIQNHSGCQKRPTYLDSSPSILVPSGASRQLGVVSTYPSNGVGRHLLFDMKRRAVETHWNFSRVIRKRKETADFGSRETQRTRRVWLSQFPLPSRPRGKRIIPGSLSVIRRMRKREKCIEDWMKKWQLSDFSLFYHRTNS